MSFKCQYCEVSFKSEKTIMVHVCEPKRRWMNKDEKYSRLAFFAYNSVKLDKWCSDAVYETYIQELNRKESADRAVERSVLLMEKWGKEHDRTFNVFFKEVSKPLAIHYIQSGRISPWVIFNCDSGAELIDSFSDHELTMINEYLDPTFWSRKFDTRQEDVEFVKSILKQADV